VQASHTPGRKAFVIPKLNKQSRQLSFGSISLQHIEHSPALPSCHDCCGSKVIPHTRFLCLLKPITYAARSLGLTTRRSLQRSYLLKSNRSSIFCSPAPSENASMLSHLLMATAVSVSQNLRQHLVAHSKQLPIGFPCLHVFLYSQERLADFISFVRQQPTI
jgi:hypothetical protein